MAEQMETTIDRCPICGGEHHYYLRTKRTVIMLLANKGNETVVKTVTCLFNCPTKGTPFQAKLKLTVPTNEKITSIDAQPTDK